ncbi:MAG: hypothetical protein HZB76_03895 [Chlamydiae bacterium]|nr:hypothetical protein [Chlamydiota bacterium]
MSYIEETIFTKIAKEKIWKAWSKAYWKNPDFQVDKKNFVVTAKGKGVKFKIVDIQENESFTVDWHSHFVKLVFFYKVLEKNNGSFISCKVKLKGFFSSIIFLILRKRLKHYVALSLQNFVKQLEI